MIELLVRELYSALNRPSDEANNANDDIADLALKSGTDVQRSFKWTFPSGATVLFKDAVISVTANGAGPSTDVATLEFEVMSNGKPIYTPAA